MSKRRNLLDSAEKRRSLQNVAMARGRLKGALQDIVVTQSDDDSDSDFHNDGPQPNRRTSKRIRTNPGESLVAHESIPIPHQSYIMKLFDRSVDLARFDERTPLYPICRAWMQNQPRANPNRVPRTPSPVKREYNPDAADQYRSGELKDVRSMPRVQNANLDRCPSPVQVQKTSSKLNIDLDAEPITKNILMQQHKKRWTQIQNKWKEHTRIREQRYVASFELLDAMVKTSS
ncbi:protein lin-37 homolog [Uranotaenia lowii]|uniref:protein lin-37 homolog n=1 Tax=Uranotaenia lowii TaxID=190385 RepID=UPI002479E84B|nr:protein lin-37 homolog [Uranotaenia lowii]XP_055590468.1 protein lin-37 homolog [Uranotaenia lowii]XP_055590473.1 protein lin-37 homolog [Uranotaenia lowii]